MDKTYIYALIDPETDLIFYIGKTDDPKKRIIQHISEAKRSRKYYRHWFIGNMLDRGIKPTMEVIEEVDFELWKEKECYYIDYYKSLGYNLVNTAPGGGAYPNWKGKHHTDETRKKISDAHKGIPAKRGPRGKRKNPQKTPRWDKGLVGRNGHKVYQYGLDGKYIAVFNSTTDAAIKTGVSQSTIARCCERRIYRAKKWIFSYESHPDGIAPFSYIHNIPVCAYTKDGAFVGRFISTKSASRELGVAASNITVVLKGGKQKTAGGYVWKYARDVDPEGE